MDFRNIAIIAHVDHGKTTLVDAILKQSGIFRENEVVEERVMDSIDQEKERGITIEAKNTSFTYRDSKFNIVDTPGHADFGGEVERILGMVDAACLLVDAAEGPLPQTRFVLQKAIEKNLKLLVIINKIDRSDARVQEVENEIFDLFIDLGADEMQMEYPTIYAIARSGYATLDRPDATVRADSVEPSLKPLFELLYKTVPKGEMSVDSTLSILISNIAYSDYLGRMAVGRIAQGKINKGDFVGLFGKDGKGRGFRVQQVLQYVGLEQKPVEEAFAGDIVILTGVPEFTIGDTISTIDASVIQKRLEVEPPTVRMTFFVNTSPLASKDGKPLLSRELGDRLCKEALRNVAIRVEEGETSDSFEVVGRGELQLSVIIEKIRREGFELAVGKPQVIMREVNGIQHEPFEEVLIDTPSDYVGAISEYMLQRKGVMQGMETRDDGRNRITFEIPSRGLIGFRGYFMTETRGMGILNARFLEFRPYAGEIPMRVNGALVADRPGKSVAYALFHLQARGRLFVPAGIDVYEGMVIGEHHRDNDLPVNVLKEKKLTNIRASGKDEMIQLSTYTNLSLERALEWIDTDEIVEVTPKHLRIRKKSLKVPGR